MNSFTKPTASNSPNIDRRSFFRHVAGAAAATLAAPAILRTASAETPSTDPFVINSRYQRMFANLKPATFDQADLKRLALGDGKNLVGMTAEPELLVDAIGKPSLDAKGAPILTATPENEYDDEENFGVPAGYTYFGQFIDHDLSFSSNSSLSDTTSATEQLNLRSARFDLDSVYGRGPADQPYLYAANGRHLVVGRKLHHPGQHFAREDLARLNGRALIGDKRNDENVIVSQLHASIIAYHNCMVDEMPNASLEEVQQKVRHHYQWVVLTDFLPRICGKQTCEDVLSGFGEVGRTGNWRANRRFTAQLVPGAIPLEFSDAAYRFGHSMIRPIYRLNTHMRGTALERKENPAAAGRRFIFAASSQSGLNGFRELPAEWAIDWKLFFEIENQLTYEQVRLGRNRVQAAYKFDTSLVNPLAFLPEFSTPTKGAELARDPNGHPQQAAGQISNLALRNLMRCAQHAHPSGQDVATALGIEPIADVDLKIGKATLNSIGKNPTITDFGDSFRGKAPLWTYILAEAQHEWTKKVLASNGSEEERLSIPSTLGPVGGRLVAETFVTLMLNDPQSILNQGANWQPSNTNKGRFTMADMLQTAMVA